MQNTLLYVEDDKDLREFTKQMLMEENFNVITAKDGIEALEKVKSQKPDLVILDLGLPKIGGESICQNIKEKNPDLPVIILTGKDDTSDIVKGFDIGADDYITKPFEVKELVARIRARLRHNGEADSRLSVADLTLDDKKMEVHRGNKQIDLTPKEYDLLKYLLTNQDRVVTRDMILGRIWAATDFIEPRVVDVYIGYLRKKIDGGQKKKLIKTIRGFGYQISE